MYRERGPEEMRPVGEVEFANGVAAMCDSGIFGKTRVAAGIVGHADMMLATRVEPVLAALMRAGGDRFRGILPPSGRPYDQRRREATRHLLCSLAFRDACRFVRQVCF